MSAKRHSVLGDISAGLRGLVPTSTTSIVGHTYTLTALSPEAEDWVNGQGVGNSLVGIAISTQKPRLAAAIVAIDSVPVEQLFTPGDDMTKEQREALLSSSMENQRIWRREELLKWLRDDFDTLVIAKLDTAYAELKSRHYEALKDAENLARGIPSPP